MNKRIISAVLAASMLVPCAATAVTANAVVVKDNAAVSSNNYGLRDNIQDGVILHCFDWKYNDIKAMLPQIAEAGFTAVQTSPAQQASQSGTWYWAYQPLGFYIGNNAIGTKEELKSLCEEAEKYGIKVVVDAIGNHLAGGGWDPNQNIQSDLKDHQYWHRSNYTSNTRDGTGRQAINWKDRWQVTHGDIGMPDLNTENSYVQNCAKNYLLELKGIGVDGIRWDTTKHIGLPSEGDNFWPTMASVDLYQYGEILGGPDDRESGNEGLMKEYTNYLTVTDSDYGKTLRDSFNSGNAPSSFGNWVAKGISNDKLIYWGESHDTWSNDKDWGFSNEMSQNVIDRAYAVAASRNKITALYFSRPSSTSKESIKQGEKGSTHFTSPEVGEVNKFHNAMVGKADYYKASNGCSVITRQGGGAVIVKGSGSGSVSVENGGGYAKPGTYKDQISGNEFTVTATTISGQVGSSGIAVIYDAVPPTPTPSLSANPGSTSYKTDTLTLTLSAKNTTNAQYSVDGGSYQSYSDGKTITIGSGAAYGTTTTVALKASNEYGTAEETYTYTKVDPSAAQRVYFDNSSYNWSNVYAYIYKDKTESTAWPGTKMTLDSSTGYYVIDIDDAFSDGAIMFSDGTNSADKRYPADQQPGLPLDGKTKIFKANHTFEDYQPVNPTTPTTPTQPTTPVGDKVLLGDTNQDGKISVSDVTEVQLYLNEMTTFSKNQKIAADVNEDKSIDIMDATYIMMYLVKDPSSKAKVGQYVGGGQPTTQPTTPTTQPISSHTVYFKNTSNFGTPTAYYWSDSNTTMTTWPGKAMTKVSGDVYSIELPAEAKYIIFSDNGGNKTGDLTIPGFGQMYSGGNWSAYNG